MKRKITLILVFILAICLVFSVNVSAYNENESEEITESAGEEISSSDTYEENENFFTVLYEGVKANADKILSALAFLGSLLIALAYKRGLFPFVEKALTSLSGAVVKLGNETKKNAESENEFLSALSEKLKTTEDILLGFTESLKKLEAELASFSEEKGEREKLKLIMATEVDMLNEIILASSLPQYQKERAGECFMKMKAKLNTEVSGDESKN